MSGVAARNAAGVGALQQHLYPTPFDRNARSVTIRWHAAAPVGARSRPRLRCVGVVKHVLRSMERSVWPRSPPVQEVIGVRRRHPEIIRVERRHRQSVSDDAQQRDPTEYLANANPLALLRGGFN